MSDGEIRIPVHERIAEAVRPRLADDGTGHAMDHCWRVYRLGRRLADAEGADFEIVGAAALVHDLHRVTGEEFVHPRETVPAVRKILGDVDFPDAKRDAVCHCVACHEEYEFTSAPALDHVPTIEEQVVRDADNLDALGAIGIARAVRFGAAHGNRLYDPAGDSDETYDRTNHDATLLEHAREKLLRLPEAMETETGQRTAADRAAFVQQFVERVEAEWAGRE